MPDDWSIKARPNPAQGRTCRWVPLRTACSAKKVKLEATLPALAELVDSVVGSAPDPEGRARGLTCFPSGELKHTRGLPVVTSQPAVSPLLAPLISSSPFQFTRCERRRAPAAHRCEARAAASV